MGILILARMQKSVMAFFLFLLLPLTFFLIFHLYPRPPGPWPWPIVGNLYHIDPVRFRFYADWAQSYGPIISIWFGSTLNIVISNSELAKEVLREKDQQLAYRHRSRAGARFSRDGKDLIWADYGPHYVKVCTVELFSSKRLLALRSIREEEVTAMVESIFRDCTNPDNMGKNLLVRKYLGAATFDNITRFAFGKRFESSEGVMDKQGKEMKAILQNGLKLGASLALAEHIPSLRWLFPFEEEAFSKHGARRDRLTKLIMDEHILARQEGSGAKQHFIDALLTVQDQYDLSEDTIIDLLWDMITAGMDATSTTVEWAMAELIKNPRVQQKAQEELERVIGPERIITEVDISHLPYLQSVAKEALRLHPPTPLMFPHRSKATVKVGGYDIPKGSNLHVNVWAIGRDPAMWKNPLEFCPEQFLEEEDVDMKGHDFRFVPFGAGRRVCPGAQLGINLMKSMLAHLLHHFSWSPPNGLSPEEIDMTENPGIVTFMRTPLQAVPTTRLPAILYKHGV